MDLPKRFHNFLLESRCLPEGSRVLVAVSGGADSVALLHLLHASARELPLCLIVAHLDHALRAESADDARFVAALCERLDIPAVMARQDVAEIARQRKGNLEEVAREVRREFLMQAAGNNDCDLIALGQHADDQAETFLLRLLRGAGSTGLAGMSLVNGHFVRPLLHFHRDELVGYLTDQALDWREDASNQDLRFTRNRIRHDLLPMLESFNPGIRRQLAETCARIAVDEGFLSLQVDAAMARCSQDMDGGIRLDLPEFAKLHPALSARVLRRALLRVRGDLRGITSAHVAAIQTLIDGDTVQGELDLPAAWVARRYNELLFHVGKPELPEYFEITIRGEGRYPLPDGRFVIFSLEKSPADVHLDVVEFAADEVPFPLTLRHCREGDRIRPSGMFGRKKLQDLFVDQKLTREVRQNALLLLKGSEVLWVLGIRRCEGYKPTAGADVLRVAIEA